MKSLVGFLKHTGCALGHLLHLVADQVERDPVGAATVLRTAAGAVGVPVPAQVDRVLDVAAQVERAAGR